MSSQSERIQTIHGDIEVETVDCVHCENALLAENAVHVVVNPRTNHGFGSFSTLHATGGTHVPMCAYCAESVFGITVDPHGWLGTFWEQLKRKIAEGDKAGVVYGLLIGVTVGWLSLLLLGILAGGAS